MNTIPQVEQIGTDEQTLFILRDGQGSEVRVAPGAGFNAYSFRVQFNGETQRVLVEPEEGEQLMPGSFGYGYPILFPFAHRIREGRYVFEGQEYQLDINWKDGNAIHGLAYNRPWEVIEQGSNETSAHITARFDTRLHADLQRQYPFDAVVMATYTLEKGSLAFDVHIENVGGKSLPMSFGVHPWFPIPLTSGGANRREQKLQLPASGRWEMEAHIDASSEQLLPTGRILPVDGEFDFRQGKALGSQFIDDVFTGLGYEGEEHICRVTDGKAVLEMKSSPASSFRDFVVYAPLDRDIICLEPYSSTSDAPNMQDQGIDAGLVVLEPKGSWRAHIEISLRGC